MDAPLREPRTEGCRSSPARPRLRGQKIARLNRRGPSTTSSASIVFASVRGKMQCCSMQAMQHGAVVAQLVERKLPKLEVAGSRPVRRFDLVGKQSSSARRRARCLAGGVASGCVERGR